MVEPQQNPPLPEEGPSAWPAQPFATHDPAVDAILAQVMDLPSAPSADHPARYLALHDALRAELDADPQPQPQRQPQPQPQSVPKAQPVAGSGPQPPTGPLPSAGPRSGRSE
jgi:hypothetical protein